MGLGLRAGERRRYEFHWQQPAERPEALVTAWVALDDAGTDNGALEVVPGSHRLATVPTRKSERLFESFEIDDRAFDASALRPIPVAAGGVIFFGPLLVHGSGANHSNRDRRALLYTFQPAGLRTQLDNTRNWARAEARQRPP